MPLRLSSNRSELIAASCAALLASLAACGGAEDQSPAVEFDAALKNRITVSGVSAGGYMAVQAHVAFADKIGGAGVVAAGPYHCARGDVQVALANCMTGEGLSVEPLVAALLGASRWVRDGAMQALAKIGWRPGNDRAGAAYWAARQEWERCVQIGTPAVEPLIRALRGASIGAQADGVHSICMPPEGLQTATHGHSTGSGQLEGSLYFWFLRRPLYCFLQ